MDKEIHIDNDRAAMYYTWTGRILKFIKVRKRILVAITPIEPNRAQTLTEIAERLERIREVFAEKRKNRRQIFIAKQKIKQHGKI